MTARGGSAVALEGAPNFRDLGGLWTGDGRTVRCGVLFRSEALATLTDRDLDTLARLRIALACDLRTARERERHASRWPPHATPAVLELDILSDARNLSRASLRELLTEPSGASARAWMLRNYASMPTAFSTGVRRLVSRIVDHEQLPLLVHCAAGKDRTGFVCSLLLLAVGVPREAVMHDYLASDRHFDRGRLADVMADIAQLTPEDGPPSPRAIEAMMGRAEYLEVALETIDRDHGGVEQYLERHGGLDAPRRSRLRELLTT